MSKETVKTQIDTDITNKTTSKSISPLNVGGNMKAVVDLIPDITSKEDILNKSINIIIDNNSDIKYPTTKAVATYVDSKDSRPYKVYTALLTQTGSSNYYFRKYTRCCHSLLLKYRSISVKYGRSFYSW